MADDEELELETDDEELVLDDDEDVTDEVDLDDVDADVDVDAIISEPVGDAKVVVVGDGDDDEDDENLDLEDEHHPDDVEEPLDVLLAERTAAERIDEEEADLEDDDEPDNPAEGTGKIVPRRDDEFLCRSCFLVKPRSQLAKGEKDLCRDCE